MLQIFFIEKNIRTMCTFSERCRYFRKNLSSEGEDIMGGWGHFCQTSEHFCTVRTK